MTGEMWSMRFARKRKSNGPWLIGRIVISTHRPCCLWWQVGVGELRKTEMRPHGRA